MTSRQTIDFFCLRLGRSKKHASWEWLWEVNVIWIPLDMPKTADIEKWRVLPAEERHLFSKSLYNSNKVSWLSFVVLCRSRHVCGTPLILKPSDAQRASQKSVGAGAFLYGDRVHILWVLLHDAQNASSRVHSFSFIRPLCSVHILSSDTDKEHASDFMRGPNAIWNTNCGRYPDDLTFSLLNRFSNSCMCHKKKKTSSNKLSYSVFNYNSLFICSLEKNKLMESFRSKYIIITANDERKYIFSTQIVHYFENSTQYFFYT